MIVHLLPTRIRHRVALAAVLMLATSCGGAGVSGTPAPSAAASAGAASASAAPSAAPAADAALIAAAKKEGNVTLYAVFRNEALQDMAAAFKAKYGIDLNFTYLASGALTERVKAELQASRPVDVIIHGDSVQMVNWGKEGVLSKLDPAPGFEQMNPYQVTVGLYAQGIVYNTQLVKSEELRTWADVLQPKFKDRLVVGSPRLGPGYLRGYYTLLHDSKYGKTWFESLAKQSPRLVLQGEQVPQTVASGQASVGLLALSYYATDLVAKAPTAPIAFKYLDSSAVVPFELGIPVKAAHPNAAKLLAQWIMTRDGQITAHGHERGSSPLGSLPGTVPIPEKSVLQNPDQAIVAGEAAGITSMFDTLGIR